MEIDAKVIEQMVQQALREIRLEQPQSFNMSETGYFGVYETMEEAINASEPAQSKLLFAQLTERQRYVDVIRTTVLKRENLELISRLTVEETEMGNYEHKLIKNRLAAEKTPGTEDLMTEAVTGDRGLTLIEYCPFGIVGAITPTTNPTETIINNAISAIAGGNTIVFSPHPRAKKVSQLLVKMLNKALVGNGAPADLITIVEEPSLEETNAMIANPKIRLLAATGGPAIVKKVMASGKKAIGAGAGNPPVVVDETADIEKAAKDIINGCSFDNNILCIAEKEVFAVDDICDHLIHHMKQNGAYEITDKALLDRITKLVTNESGGPETSFIGKSARYILERAGIMADNGVRTIIAEVDRDHLLVKEEMMMPILPIVRTADVDTAIMYAREAEGGNRHTAVMHSKNIDKLSKMAKVIDTTIFVKNAPSYAGVGIGGEGFSTFTIAGPTGEGLTTARSFCRKRKCVMADAFSIR